MTRTSPRGGGPAWRDSQANDRGLPVLPIAIGLVALLALAAIVVTLVGGDDDTDPTSSGAALETAPVAVSGEVLPTLEPGDDQAVGLPAPTLDGQAFDGSALDIGDDGRPKVLVFLAHWCPHCQREVPVLVSWFAEHGVPSDVDVYGVATGTDEERPNYPPSAWLEREGWAQPTLADSVESDAASAFGLSAYPFFVAVDAEGTVVGRGSGELTPDAWEDLLDLARG